MILGLVEQTLENAVAMEFKAKVDGLPIPMDRMSLPLLFPLPSGTISVSDV